MNHEDRNQQLEDAQVEAAIRNFRHSMIHWSEHEFTRPRTIHRSRWSAVWMAIANPVLGWTLASALIVTSVGVPTGFHHQRVLEAQRIAAQQAAVAARQKQDAELARQAAADSSAIDDEAFLDHVDSDIAQATPEAMQPLASLMSDSKAP